MQALTVPHPGERWSWPGRARRPSPRRVGALALLLIAVVVAGAVGSTLAYLRLPAPTGTYGVGRATAILTDPGRAEPRDAAGADRQVGIVAWYPAIAGSGDPAGYVPDLERIRAGLAASGEIAPLAIAGLDAIQASARTGAELAVDVGGEATRFPVVLLSPGNATNVAFYGSLAEDLASRGYVVIGVDHPYQVAAVALDGGAMAVYEGDGAAPDEGGITARIEERVGDLGFVLDRLATGVGVEALDGHLDLERVAVVGHSNGGLAAAELCRREARVQACANLDGQAAGGPLGTAPDAGVPDQPFLFLTKETMLHPTLAARFEAGGTGTFRVVIPSATHAAFADGPRFEPRLAPVDGTADHVLALERGFVGAFLDHVLRGAPATVFGELAAPADVYVEVYPLGGRPTLPTDTP